jgi:hypothetical protein
MCLLLLTLTPQAASEGRGRAKNGIIALPQPYGCKVYMGTAQQYLNMPVVNLVGLPTP